MSMSNADPAKVSNADADEVCNKLQPSQPSHPPPRHLLDGKFLRRTKSKLPTRESSSNGPVKSAKAKMITTSFSKARPRSSSIVIGQPMQCQIGRIHLATKEKWAAPPVPQGGQWRQAEQQTASQWCEIVFVESMRLQWPHFVVRTQVWSWDEFCIKHQQNCARIYTHDVHVRSELIQKTHMLSDDVISDSLLVATG